VEIRNNFEFVRLSLCQMRIFTQLHGMVGTMIPRLHKMNLETQVLCNHFYNVAMMLEKAELLKIMEIYIFLKE
jgi:hypothetical protein